MGRSGAATGTKKSDPGHLPRLLPLSGQLTGEQSEDKGTDKPNDPESHNGLLYCYEGTNITGERAVNPHQTQLIDALIESYALSRICAWPAQGSP